MGAGPDNEEILMGQRQGVLDKPDGSVSASPSGLIIVYSMGSAIGGL